MTGWWNFWAYYSEELTDDGNDAGISVLPNYFGGVGIMHYVW